VLKPILLAILILLTSLTFSHANSLEKAMIEGVKFLDEIPEVEWYRVDRKSLIIGWRGIPQFSPTQTGEPRCGRPYLPEGKSRFGQYAITRKNGQ